MVGTKKKSSGFPTCISYNNILPCSEIYLMKISTNNTYTQIHIQCVFAVQFRAAMIADEWRTYLHKYIRGIISAQGHKLLSINSLPDHMHILFGMRPVQSLSDLMQDIKGGSSKWINLGRLTPGRFQWQEGYGAFSYCKSEVETVRAYIENQQQHHKKVPFLTEYQSLLDQFDVTYDRKYLFREPM
jgi:putative transposase